jgi:tetrahydromethanopterin S-methyltransferase subunit C
MKFYQVLTKSDWLKIIILLIVAIIFWAWVYIEYSKPVIPPEWQKQWEEESQQVN